jgi:hypothetical protein
LVSHLAYLMRPWAQVYPEQGTKQPLFLDPFRSRAVAIRRGTHSVFGCIRELFGVGTRVVFGWKNESNGSVALLCCIACATHCDIRIGGSPTNPSFLSAIITSLEWRIPGESPRGAYDKSALNSS